VGTLVPGAGTPSNPFTGGAGSASANQALTAVTTSANGFQTTRVINGQLYFGNGNPVTSGATPTIVQSTPALPAGAATGTTTNATSNGGANFFNEFAFLARNGSATINTLYVATDNGGLLKYSVSGTTATFVSSTTVNGASSFFGLAARNDPLNPNAADIFLTTGNGSQSGGATNQLVEFIDNAAPGTVFGANGAATPLLATSPAGNIFKGLDFAPQATPAPEPGTLLLGGFAALGMAGANYLRRRRAAAVATTTAVS